MLELYEGDIVSRCDGKPCVFVDELKRTRGSEAELVNIACSALHIRDPRAHVPLSLTATCQPCSVSLKAGRSTYKVLDSDAEPPPKK